jgi:DNA repair exonuclease SbcCD ATPase subunit
MITDVPEERPTTDRAVNTQQLRNDLQQCHDMRLRDAAELRSLSSELTQARARIETLQAALQSAQRDCSKCSDHESLESELDRLRDQIRSKDRTIEELEQQNIDSAIPDNEFFSDHRNENIGNGYDELQRDYEQLQATAEELEIGLKAEVKSLQDRMEIETKKYEEL